MPNNILEVLLRGLGQGVSAYPGAVQEQTQFQRSNLREMLGMQEKQKEQSATEMYRQKMMEMQQQQQELAGNKAMMDVQQGLLERFMPPQVAPADQADLDYKKAQTDKIRWEMGQGTKKPEKKDERSALLQKMLLDKPTKQMPMQTEFGTELGTVPLGINELVARGDSLMNYLNTGMFNKYQRPPQSRGEFGPMGQQQSQAPQMDITQVDAMIKALEDSLAAYGK